MQKEAALERGVPGRTRRRPARWPPLGAGLSAPPWPSPHGWAQAPALSPPGLSPISVLGAARPVPSVLGVTGDLRKRKGVTPFLHSNCLRTPGAMPASRVSVETTVHSAGISAGWLGRPGILAPHL